MSRHICVVTAGHLATCPRMLKAADALALAGYNVRVVSARYMSWATEVDKEIYRQRAGAWDWTVVDYDRDGNFGTYLFTGVRFRLAQFLAKTLGSSSTPLAFAIRAYSRVHTELLRAALSKPADFFYGGTAGALAVVAEAGRRTGVPYALDLEDFHSAEQDDSGAARLAHSLAEKIEGAVLRGATFITAGSPGIADAYNEKYDVKPITINNTFPLPALIPDFASSSGDSLRLYWFSQTIGPGRGLEDAIGAMGLADIPGQLHIRGRAIPGYIESLQRLTKQLAPRLALMHHEPAVQEPVELCRGYDVGLALEQAHVLNRAICRTNKSFTYMLAGLATVFTDTLGQKPLALDLGNGAFLYEPGDVHALASGLKRWARDKNLLGRAKAAAWEAANRRWHWEHPLERGALLEAIARTIG